MISSIFKYFQSVLSQSSLAVGIYLKKFKIALGYPKTLIVVKLIIDKKTHKDGVTVTVKLACDKELIY